MKKHVKSFQNSQVSVDGGVIFCESNAFLSASVSQFFIEKIPNNRPFRESSQMRLIFELNSGSIYSFSSDKADFINEVFNWMKAYFSPNIELDKWLIDLENGSIVNQKFAKPEIKNEKTDATWEETFHSNFLDGTIGGELRLLIFYCQTHEDVDEQLLPLLMDIEKNRQNRNAREQAELYRKMINLSVVSLCNELGLNMLLSEMKTRIYD